MEYCSNGDLFEYILRHRNIPEREACIWFKQIISGLQHIHKNGFAHRDLKCENILLNDSYVLKIMDFGFCCRLKYPILVVRDRSELKDIRIKEFPSKTVCGSYLYASPELLKGKPYLPTKADIWSAGVILYVMLFGSYPNDGYELEEFIRNDEHFIEIPKYPEVSDECKEVMNNILINEESRYTSEQIMESNWFRKEWPKVLENNDIKTIQNYFENLNITRQETLEFTFNEDREIDPKSESSGLQYMSNSDTSPSLPANE